MEQQYLCAILCVEMYQRSATPPAGTRPARPDRSGPDLRVWLLVLACVAVTAPAAAWAATRGVEGGGVLVLGCVCAAALAATIWAVLRPLAAAARLLNGPGESGIHPARMLSQIRAVTAQLETLERGAVSNPVSGLPTREAFAAAVAEELAAASGGVLGVIRVGDYDELAAFDIRAADKAVASFAARLQGSLAKGRLAGHIDRDRFAIWFGGAREASELQALAYVLSQEIADGQIQLSPQVRTGAALYPRDGVDAEALLACAAAALTGAGRPAPAAPSVIPSAASAAARERFAMGQEVRRALQRNQLSLKYQPVVDLKQSRVIGAEALLRWTHPELGEVPPSDFVPMLEQSGQMQEVGLWVLNAACREARTWRDQGLGDLKMAVNLSPMQCRDGLGAVVMRTLERHQLEPCHLELELTETAAMEDREATRLLLAELRGLGVDVAIDDFGAGYSSLTYLKNLPFSKLKIDREFVTRVDERRDSQAICSALIALAKGLSIRVLAEGVERREELETLRSLGCPLIQGYYFARPLESGAFVRTVTDPEWLTLAASPVHRQRALIDRRGAV